MGGSAALLEPAVLASLVDARGDRGDAYRVRIIRPTAS
jgi:hypothetical protein